MVAAMERDDIFLIKIGLLIALTMFTCHKLGIFVSSIYPWHLSPGDLGVKFEL